MDRGIGGDEAMGPFRRFWGILTHPAETFVQIREERLGRTFLYFLILLTLPVLLMFIGSLVARPMLFGPYLGERQHWGWIFVVLSGPCAAMWSLAYLTLAVLILHLSVFFVGGRAGLPQTLRVLVYSSTPLFLSICFPPTLVVAMVWSLTLAVVGLRKAHGISTLRAVVSVLLPLIPPVALMLLGWIASLSQLVPLPIP
jgi:hypothetical protein